MCRCQLKLVEVFTATVVDADKRVYHGLLQIWKLMFGHKVNFLCRLCAIGLGKILKMNFRRDFEVEVWSVFCRCYLVKVMKLNFGRDSKARFGQDFEALV